MKFLGNKKVLTAIILVLSLVILYQYLGPKTEHGEVTEVKVVEDTSLVKLSTDDTFEDDGISVDRYQDIEGKKATVKIDTVDKDIKVASIPKETVDTVDKSSIQGKLPAPGKIVIVGDDTDPVVTPIDEIPDEKIYCYIDIQVVEGSVSSQSTYEAIDIDTMLLGETKVEIKSGDTIMDILLRVCDDKVIPVKHTPYYVSMLDNLRETPELNIVKDGITTNAGGWCYYVGDGIMPDVSCAKVTPKNGTHIHWVYGDWTFK